MDSQLKSVDRQFLEEIALQLNLTGDSLAAFLARFHRENADRENSTLVSFIAWNNQPEDSAQKLQDELARICKVLEENGCTFNRPDGQKKRGRAPKGQSPWEQAYKWLWESRFPEWQRHNQQLVSEQGETSRNGQANIDALVQQVRSRLLPVITDPDGNIGTMRMPWVNRPVPVDKIYIHLNVLEKPSGLSHFSDWRQEYEPDNRQDFDRLGLSQVEKKRVEALSAVKDYPKLMVLGKPGAGKTTFLKSLTVECIQPENIFFDNSVPLFVTLREFVKAAHRTQSWKLLDYLVWVLAEQWNGCDRANAKEILAQGRSLVLLDGLDEVPLEDLENVLDAVREFGYGINRLVITCRTQSQQELDGFTDVEVADFTPQQVDRFVDNWFKIVGSDSQESLAPKLQEQLRATENKPIAELTVTPVLLNLICAVFRDEQGNLPKKRFELYTKGMRQLLERLKRTPIDERLTIDVKEEFLAELALMLFENNDYFPEQQTLEKFIRDYFEVEGSVARKILKAFETETGLLIERSAGYWSFSHLTFQEYFAAKAMLARPDFPIQRTTKSGVLEYITRENWREVFYMMSEILDKPDSLFLSIKDFADSLWTNDSTLQELLIWLDQKSKSIKSSHRLNAIRALYLARVLNPRPDIVPSSGSDPFQTFRTLAIALDKKVSDSSETDLTIDRCMYYLLTEITFSERIEITIGRIEILTNLEIEKELYSRLSRIVDLLKRRGKHYRVLEGLHNLAIEERNIGHRWGFRDTQEHLVFQYYTANDILIYCLQSQCNVSTNTRDEIEETLLLPIAEIEKRKGGNR